MVCYWILVSYMEPFQHRTYKSFPKEQTKVWVDLFLKVEFLIDSSLGVLAFFFFFTAILKKKMNSINRVVIMDMEYFYF